MVVGGVHGNHVGHVGGGGACDDDDLVHVEGDDGDDHEEGDHNMVGHGKDRGVDHEEGVGDHDADDDDENDVDVGACGVHGYHVHGYEGSYDGQTWAEDVADIETVHYVQVLDVEVNPLQCCCQHDAAAAHLAAVHQHQPAVE